MQKKVLLNQVKDLILQEDVDIVALSECIIDVNLLAQQLNATKSSSSFSVVTTSSRNSILVRFSQKFIDNHNQEFDGRYWDFNKIVVPHLNIDLNLIVVHFPSKMFWDDVSQSFECVNLMSTIRKLETKHQSNTLVIGDFNMNPYEAGMTSALGFHAIGDKSLALKLNRKVFDSHYDFFYNPMWNLFGDKVKPVGTYYKRYERHVSPEWSIFDQLIIRPSLIKNYEEDGLKIVTQIGKTSLQNRNGKPKLSDHFPIIASFNFNF